MPTLTPAEPPSFAQTLHLPKLATAPPRATCLARSYGGHAFAQAIWAASQGIRTSNPDLHVHEANGYWTQAGFANRPFIYETTTLSLTRSPRRPFSESDADKEMGPVAFVLTCSFKRRENGPGYGLKFDAEKYGDILKRDFGSHPPHVYIRGPNGVGVIRLADFPSIEGPANRRLHLYRASSGTLDLYPNMRAALHALNHKVVFHVSPEELSLDYKAWFVQEMSSSRGGEGQGLIESWIWSPSGTLVATTVQDGLFRKTQAKLA
ncbi:uncharacterized protein BJX67DRAFT_375128 [Aspergillus lucknowensis]|uniref:Acyl-CoA thioesterase-like C-terminal domain-containing protein n=1 Tax=Aspergillus lucknowensis TaxID=176173 RepID=A0ABR4LDV4_9EURO